MTITPQKSAAHYVASKRYEAQTYVGMTRFAVTYQKIRQVGIDALAVKLCDRIENVKSCIRTQDSRLRMYQREYSVFRSELIQISSDDRIQSLWTCLDKLLLQPTA